MNKTYYQCNDITTVDGAKYNRCVVSIPEVVPTGNDSLDRQTMLDDIMTALESTLAVEVECFSNMEELSWE